MTVPPEEPHPKYFASVEEILDAQHAEHIEHHLARLNQLSEQPGEPLERLTRVLEAYAMICHHRGRQGMPELVAQLHRADVTTSPETAIRELITRLVGETRSLGPRAAGEISTYCLHALRAASDLHSEAAVRRLVATTLSGVQHGAY